MLLLPPLVMFRLVAGFFALCFLYSYGGTSAFLKHDTSFGEKNGNDITSQVVWIVSQISNIR